MKNISVFFFSFHVSFVVTVSSIINGCIIGIKCLLVFFEGIEVSDSRFPQHRSSHTLTFFSSFVIYFFS